ncbi:hypothetical protein IMG5_194280 [Ichthyophthirius multifiliis]|uniref:Uncharacterized protein n=1 Tax=Ichthyophthirius multifiliis TaxID=5932 RepID=G0R4Q8_ICHMU|nr:hypothetical protein IMG5_194280 [Ichthyophthirius multifiliis]EGR27565.1 hypothetical protein IMG5_194280 [Ichthyophthirius multifiliis]|eukprot:XP_004025017.1 hypothetical protein IMG5_194280 [Ichthyophthirius multifiliis]
MGLSTFKYWDRVKLAFNNVKMEGQILWTNIKSRADQAKNFFENQFKKKIVSSSEKKGRLLFQETQRQLDGSIDINNLEFATVFGQVQDVADNFQTEGLTEVLNNVSDFKSQVEQQTENSGGLIQRLIKQIVSKLEFSKSFPSQTRKIPVDYAYTYSGKIAKFKLVLNAQWEVTFNTGIQFKNGLLDFKAGINTKVSVNGNISFGISIGEVGGTAEGTFLNTQVQIGLGLKVLEKFAGQVYIDGNFSPYAFKIGAYLNLSLQKENKVCGKNNKRYLGTAKKNNAGNVNVQAIGQAADLAKKNQKVVSSVNKNSKMINSATNAAKDKAIQEAKGLGSGSITNVKSAVQDIVGGDETTLVKNESIDNAQNQCQVNVEAVPKKDYIFGPFEFIGETYKKRLLDKSWNGYNQSKEGQ